MLEEFLKVFHNCLRSWEERLYVVEVRTAFCGTGHLERKAEIELLQARKLVINRYRRYVLTPIDVMRLGAGIIEPRILMVERYAVDAEDVV